MRFLRIWYDLIFRNQAKESNGYVDEETIGLSFAATINKDVRAEVEKVFQRRCFGE